MLTKKLNKKKSSLLFLIPVTLILSSCGATSSDIKAAQKLAQLQDQAKTIFPSIANDVEASCTRTAELTLLSPPTPSQPQIDENRRAARKVCQGNPAAATKALNDANRIILDYLEALGKLAADDLTNFDKQLDGISSSLQNLPKLGTEEKKEAVDAGTAIAKFLFKAATDAYRREQLRLAVTTVDAPLQTLVTALNKAVIQHYINGVLNNEQIAVDNYYRYYLERVLRAPRGESVSARVETETNKDSEWRDANKEISEKKDLAIEYLGLLQKIADDHHTLYKMYVKGEEPSPVQVKQMIDKYSKQLKSLTEKSEKLFPKN
jgi:hypothetical protein